MKKLALFEGSWQKVLIKVALLLLVLFVAYRLLKGVFKKKPSSQVVVENFIQNELPVIPPVDNSSITDPDTISDSEAELVANGLEQAMSGFGTTESVLMNMSCYNGASLNKVYAKFGVRPYSAMWSATQQLDLFGWFGEELSNMSGQWVWCGADCGECVAGCESYWDFCGELTYQRNLWSKSSIPITF